VVLVTQEVNSRAQILVCILIVLLCLLVSTASIIYVCFYVFSSKELGTVW